MAKDQAERRWASGPLVQLCAIHELTPSLDSEESITVVLGIAVCRKHLTTITDAIVSGYTMAETLESVVNDQFV